MKNKLSAMLCLSILVLPLAACTVEQTEEGELPEVEATGGELPEYDVDAAEIEVGTEEKEVTVPDVDIEPPSDDDDDEPPVGGTAY